ncbi:heavy-metal-associated domain-containing protein [Tautonia marina]|uniref:heavy-metal-associated domain-containing protein n=1 Tax=Tautonia marina TaxID=2653855 RepID=UPI0013760FD7|nr:hypothetical protein [Tautonia marina]
MNPFRTLALLAAAALIVPAAAVATADRPAEEKTITLEGVHLCCGACVRAVDEAAKPIEGVTVTCDQDLGTVVMVSKDVKALQRTLDAITAAGYHGTPDSDLVIVKDDSGATDKPVETLTLTGLHNCCRGCAVAVQEALGEVEGIETIKAEPRSTTVTLSGKVIPLAAVEALNAAGFHVKVKND